MGQAGRPAADLRRRADALVEADHEVPSRGRAGTAGARRSAGAHSHDLRGERRAATADESRRSAARRTWHSPRAGGRRLNESAALPFDNSRRLTGSNLFFDSTGAVLETVGVEVDEALLAGWRSRVARARAMIAAGADDRAQSRIVATAPTRDGNIAGGRGAAAISCSRRPRSTNGLSVRRSSRRDPVSAGVISKRALVEAQRARRLSRMRRCRAGVRDRAAGPRRASCASLGSRRCRGSKRRRACAPWSRRRIRARLLHVVDDDL